MGTNKNQIVESLEAIVRFARTGEYGNAASALNQCLPEVQKKLVGLHDPDSARKIAYSLETMMIMQQQKDWVAFADVLEYEFIPLLKSAAATESDDC